MVANKHGHFWIGVELVKSGFPPQNECLYIQRTTDSAIVARDENSSIFVVVILWLEIYVYVLFVVSVVTNRRNVFE